MTFLCSCVALWLSCHGNYRFATELSGRKGRRTAFGFEGLRVEMEKAGWVVE